jgi:hypothetical protein
MNAVEQKKWAEQWKAAGTALEAVRMEELSRLDESQNASIAASFFPGSRRGGVEETSGLVEQQAVFRKALLR